MSLNASMGLGVTLSADDGASPKLIAFGQNMQRAGAQATSAAGGISVALRTIGVGAAALGGAGLGFLGLGLREASAFGKEIALVATETDLAKLSVQQMKDMTRGLAGEFGRLPVDQAKAMYDAIGMQGASMTAEKTSSIMRASNLLAVAGNADLTTRHGAVGGAMRAYGANFMEASS